MPPETDAAICLRAREWSETSQVVTLLTESHGVLTLVAKGSRREKAPFSGGLEALTAGMATLVPKRSEAMPLLVAWDLERVWSVFRTDLVAWNAGFLLADLAARLLPIGEPHPSAFARMMRCLDSLDSGAMTADETVARTLDEILRESGHELDIDRDARDGGPLGPEEPAVLDLASHGLVRPGENGAGLRVAGVLPETRGVIRAIRMHGTSPLDPRHAARAARLLAAWAAGQTGAEPPSLTAFTGQLSEKARGGRGQGPAATRNEGDC